MEQTENSGGESLSSPKVLQALFRVFVDKPGVELTYDEIAHHVNQGDIIGKKVYKKDVLVAAGLIKDVDPSLLVVIPETEDLGEKLKLSRMMSPNILTNEILSKGGFDESVFVEVKPVNINVEVRHHGTEVPAGALDRLRSLFTFAGFDTSEESFNVILADKLRCSEKSPIFKFEPVDKKGSVTFLMKATDNDSRWRYYLFGQHGFSANEIYERLNNAATMLNLSSNNVEREKHRGFASRIIRESGCKQQIVDSFMKLSHRVITRHDIMRVLANLDIDMAYGSFLKYILKEGIIEKKSRTSYLVLKPRKEAEPEIQLSTEELPGVVLPKKVVKKISVLATDSKKFKELSEEIQIMEARLTDLRTEMESLRRSKEDYDMILEVLSGGKTEEL